MAMTLKPTWKSNVLIGFIIVNLICNTNGNNALKSSDYNGSNDLCPSMCTCDAFKSLNRANCSNQRLISANIEMSAFVEVLDLSHNDITTIDDKCFTQLKRVTLLRIDYNGIHTIDLDAFYTLKELKHLSLSYNRLERFDRRIFEQNTKLITLNLAGNNFMNLANQPIFKSQSVEALDLHESKLSHLHLLFFRQLPNLKTIDLSKNLLITIAIGAFDQNLKMESLKIDGNPLACDIQMEMTLLLLKRRNIKATFQNCPVPKVRQMFERMQMLPSQEDRSMSSISKQSKRLNVTTVWRTANATIPILNEVCPLADNDKACDLFETCILNFSMLLKEVEEKLSNKRPVGYDSDNTRSWLHSITVQMGFYAGLFVGSVFGGSCIFICGTICAESCKSQKDIDRENRRRYRRRTNRKLIRPTQPEDRIQDLESISRHTSIQPPAHQTTARSDDDRNREIVEYRQPIVNQRRGQQSSSFFSLFFERPARRRYYQQFNRNATNLVRRLSQSRLFLNSSRAQNANWRNSYVSNANRSGSNNVQTPTRDDSNNSFSRQVSNVTPSPMEEYQSEIHSSAVSLPSLVPSNSQLDITPSAPLPDNLDDGRYASEPNLATRSETPPPAYTDILIITTSNSSVRW